MNSDQNALPVYGRNPGKGDGLIKEKNYLKKMLGSMKSVDKQHMSKIKPWLYDKV